VVAVGGTIVGRGVFVGREVLVGFGVLVGCRVSVGSRAAVGPGVGEADSPQASTASTRITILNATNQARLFVRMSGIIASLPMKKHPPPNTRPPRPHCQAVLPCRYLIASRALAGDKRLHQASLYQEGYQQVAEYTVDLGCFLVQPFQVTAGRGIYRLPDLPETVDQLTGARQRLVVDEDSRWPINSLV
jgi:hypothetical protein